MRWTMEEKIKALKEQMEAALGSVESKEQLGEFWQNFLRKERQHCGPDERSWKRSEGGAPERW